ncbi:MAG TPA: hypothetical protein VFP70_07330 [Burkholderiales bacterium]|nr:hypothetical protein [Burkholderiales bacterium]
MTADGAVVVRFDEFRTDTVVRFALATVTPRLLKLQSRNIGIWKMVVDAQARLFCTGSHCARLGWPIEAGTRALR